MRRLDLIFLFLLLCVIVNAKPVSDNSLIGLPPNIIEGSLENGLRYLILHNKQPENLVEMRLVMQVGSVQEEKGEEGVAHFLEHMAFKGTAHFPERGIVDYCERIGMKYGRDLNAFTGHDRTVYMLTVPIDKSYMGTIDSTLLIMRDWLCDIKLDENKIKQECGIILEELRNYDVGDEFYSLKIGNNRFSDHIPLGTAEHIQQINKYKLERFYKRWYVPEKATLVIVGDIEPQIVERKIKSLFSSIPQKPVNNICSYPLEYEKGLHLREVCDTLRNNLEVELIIPHPCVVGSTLGKIYHKELGRLLIDALSRRLNARQISVSVSDTWYLSDTNHLVFSLTSKDKDALLSQITNLSGELHYIVSTGFHSEELKDVIDAFVRRKKNFDMPLTSTLYCEDLTDYIISGDRYIYTEDDWKCLYEKIRLIKEPMLQNLLKDWLAYMKETLLVASRTSSPSIKITESDIASAWERGKYLSIQPYEYKQKQAEDDERITTPSCLTKKNPYDKASISSLHSYENLCIKAVRLNNGLTILLRPTDDETGIFHLSAFARGGIADLLPEEVFLYDETAGYIEMGGIASVPYDSLMTYMAQNSIAMNIGIGNYWHELFASAPEEKAMELFNLVYEKLHNPELRYEDFEEVRNEAIDNFGKKTLLDKIFQQTPERLLNNKLDSLVGNVTSVARQRTQEDLRKLNLDSIANYYRRLFTDPSQMTILLTGTFNVDSILPSLISTFARMKRSTDAYVVMDTPFIPVKGFYQEHFEGKSKESISLEYLLTGNYTPSLRTSLILKLIRDILQNRVLLVLREQENIVYSPYVSLFYNGIPQQTYYYQLSAIIDRENMERVNSLVQQIIEELQKELISKEELDNLKRSFIIKKSNVLNDRATADWKNTIVNLLKNGESLEDFNFYEQCLSTITPEDIQDAFREYLSLDRSMLLYIQ